MNYTQADWIALSLSLKVGLLSTTCAFFPALILAWVLARKEFVGKKMVEGIAHLPLVLPPVVTGYFLLMVFGKKGYLGALLYKFTGLVFAFNFKGAALAAMVVSFPLVLNAIRLAIEGVDPELEQAALTLGISPVRVFLRVTLPLSLHGIVAGLLLGFARALGEFGATITFVSNIPGETQTLPLAIYNQMQIPGQESKAFALVILSLILSFGSILLAEIFRKRMVAPNND